MRYKPVPEPTTLERLATLQDALPLVPDSVDDCCLRLQRRADVPDREQAQQWLPFLVALGLANEQQGAYYRAQTEVDSTALAERFEERVLGASKALDTLDQAPQSAKQVFEQTRDLVPQWERNRDPAWEQTWRDRTERLLEWAVRFGRAESRDGGYVLATK